TQNFSNTLAAGGGYDEDVLFRRAFQPPGLLFDLPGGQGIGFVEGYDFLFGRQALPVGRQLITHRPVSRSGIVLRAVDEMQQNPATLDVSEEAIAQPHPLVSPLD